MKATTTRESEFSSSIGNIFSYLIMFVLLQFASVSASWAQDPDLPPSGNFDLTDWKITLEDQSEVQEADLSNGFERPAQFYTDPNTGAMVFRCRNDGETGGSSYPRSELREMLRAGNTSFNTQGIGPNNWVFASSSQANQEAAGGVGGTLTATVAVDHVSTTGEAGKVGRVIIGQIHASNDEPCRIYYRKLPGNTKGAIYFAHEPTTSAEQWHEMIGSRSDNAPDPEDGIALGEKFSYEIKVEGNDLTVTIMRPGKPDVQKVVDMTDSGFADDWMYFKAGVYNQNNSGEEGDYCQASFFALSNAHSTASNKAPISSITAPSSGATFSAGENITISADASDSDGSIAKVEFFHGSTKLGEVTSPPYDYTWSDVPAGRYVITATATDDGGISYTALGVSIAVNPVAEYNAPYDIPRFKAFIGECKLQAPTSSTIATQTQLKDGYTDANFYVVDEDKVAFNQSGSSKRTELRYLNNWTLSEGDRSLHARIHIVEMTCDQVTVLQIHDDANTGSGPNKPLLRIYKHLAKEPVNHLWAAIKTDIEGVNTTHVDLGEAPAGYFDCDVRLVDGSMIIDVDGAEKANMDVSYWTFPSYWKAGVYLQDDGEATAYFDELYVADGSGGNVNPVVSIISPENGASFVNGDDITIVVDASDPDGTLSKVEFYNGATKLGEDSTIPYSFTIPFAVTGSYIFTAVATDNVGATTTSSEINVAVTATQTYTLTTSAVGNGFVSYNPSGGVYEAGTLVYLTAKPDDGNLFDHWSGDVTGTSPQTTIIMDADKSVTAHFSEEEVTLSVDPNAIEASNREMIVYPNPIHSKATIEYKVKKPALVELTIFNVSGQKIVNLVNELQNAGTQKVEWTPDNLPNGLYIAKLRIGNETKTQRLIIQPSK